MPLLFSYGTLQQTSVQLGTLGRLLQGSPDELVGFRLSEVRVEDRAFVAASGKAVHRNVIFTGESDSRVTGTAFEVSDLELALCDEYERPARYRRVMIKLASGNEAWVYTRSPPE